MLGQVPYRSAHSLQEHLLEARHQGSVGDLLLLLEHPPVLTTGRSTRDEHLPQDRTFYQVKGIEVVDVGRGGSVTYHGPGQLVAYPIIDLKPERKDVRRYVRDLEETMIATCDHYGVPAHRADGLQGTWVPDVQNPEHQRKVGALGVRLRRWITMHGLALNVCTDLEPFEWIIPCGLDNPAVTTLAWECKSRQRPVPTLEQVSQQLAEHLANRLDAKLTWGDLTELSSVAPVSPTPVSPTPASPAPASPAPASPAPASPA